MPLRAVKNLELEESTPRVVYTIVTIPRGRPRDMTLNLAGPIVVNVETRRAVQIILEGDEHPVRRRAFPEAEQAAA
jgi:flagellar assembly factor FliW